MNYALIRNIIGKILLLIAALMVLPLIVSLIYKESSTNVISFLVPIVGLSIFGFLLELKPAKNTNIVAREGFVIVGLSWILMSLFGCLPFLISKEIPNFFDAFFEITSGFTTTGSTILAGDQITYMSKSMLFWRSFSHWIGGMGILVFILAFIPESKDGTIVHILRAESTGPQVGKLVSKMRLTSRILYLIYLGLTVIEIIVLLVLPDNKMDFFNSLIHSFGTAGTGGFSSMADSLASFKPCTQYAVAIFMIIFSVNFSLYYLLLIGQFKEVIKNEELHWFLLIVILSIILICGSILPYYDFNFEESFRHAFFQTSSIISTTGFASDVTYASWPTFALGILMLLTLIGACAGSTAGGIKVSRLAIVSKATINDIDVMISPRKVKKIRMDKKPLGDNVVKSVKSYIITYAIIFLICALLISINNPGVTNEAGEVVKPDLLTTITASLTCISNVGPGLGLVGPNGSFSCFSGFSKMVLSFEMIAGRLELFPILILFNPRTWKKRL